MRYGVRVTEVGAIGRAARWPSFIDCQSFAGIFIQGIGLCRSLMGRGKIVFPHCIESSLE
jgi:hypothetical protein